jgi:hypothetical protein
MDDFKKLKRDLDKRRKRIDSELRKLELNLKKKPSVRLPRKKPFFQPRKIIAPIKEKIISKPAEIKRRIIPIIKPKKPIFRAEKPVYIKPKKPLFEPRKIIAPIKEKIVSAPAQIKRKIIPIFKPKKPVFRAEKSIPRPIPKPVYKLPSFITTHRSRRLAAGAGLVLLSVLLIVTVAFMFTRSVSRDEFVSRVQGCSSGKYLGQVDNSLVKYTTDNCHVTKEIVHIGDQEPKEMQVLFEGKKMTCEYRRGEFNFDDIDYFLKDIDGCWGELKDLLVELNNYKLARARSV